MDKYGIGGKKGFIENNPNKKIRYLKGLNFTFHENVSGFIKKGIVKRKFERPPLQSFNYEIFHDKIMTNSQVERMLNIIENTEGINISFHDNPEGIIYRVKEQIQFEPMPEDNPDASKLKKQGLVNIFRKDQPIIPSAILSFAEYQLPEEYKDKVFYHALCNAYDKPKVRVIKRA